MLHESNYIYPILCKRFIQIRQARKIETSVVLEWEEVPPKRSCHSHKKIQEDYATEMNLLLFLSTQSIDKRFFCSILADMNIWIIKWKRIMKVYFQVNSGSRTVLNASVR